MKPTLFLFFPEADSERKIKMQMGYLGLANSRDEITGSSREFNFMFLTNKHININTYIILIIK